MQWVNTNKILMVNLYYCYLSATFVDLCLGASVPHDIIKGEQH